MSFNINVLTVLTSRKLGLDGAHDRLDGGCELASGLEGGTDRTGGWRGHTEQAARK
jgi:hypothetical protein